MTDQHAAASSAAASNAAASSAAASNYVAPRVELDELELRVLDFERSWADRVGNREAAIRAEFGVSTARYYQMLYALIDSPIAVRHDPLLVRRLQRLRESRRRARARPFTSDSQDVTE